MPCRAGAPEEVDEERREDERPDEPGLHERGDVEGVRPEVRLPGLELVVDGERVEAEAEERVLREHVRDEVVDEEVRRGPPALGRQSRGQHLLEERGPARDDDEDPREHEAERHEEPRGQEVAAVRDQEDEEPAAETEHPATRERRELDDEQEAEQHRQRRPQAVPLLEAQVDRQQQHEHGRQLDPEVVRVSRERVDAEDVLTLDRAVDVDLARPAGERLEPARVEVPSGPLRDQELGDAVQGIGGDTRHERGEREPVEPDAAAGDQRDACDEEQEVEEELHHPLGPLGERLRRLEVEPPDQVDEQEGGEEPRA